MIEKKYQSNKEILRLNEEVRVGQHRVNSRGYGATSIIYKNANDIIIQYDNTNITLRTSWRNFTKGSFSDPIDISKRIGTVRKNKAGNIGECIEYNDSNHIRILMDTGEVINGRWENFKRGAFGGIKKPLDRTGERKQNTQGSWMTITKYINKRNIEVTFDTGYIVNTRYTEFNTGMIKDLLFPCIYNVGYIGVGNYPVSIDNKIVKVYEKWVGMLSRCYSESNRDKNPSYKFCEVDEIWFCYQNFAEWFEENYYEIPGQRMCLDKDILIKNNKKYGPEKCCIVPNNINVLFTKANKKRGLYPIGVSKRKNFYSASVMKNGKHIYLGEFNNPVDAFNIYKLEKEKQIKYMADKYKEYLPANVYDALYKYQVEITD